jgi:hypothetical protein
LTKNKPTLIAYPSVFFIFPTAHFFLIQFYADPQTALWLLPQTHKPTLKAKAKEPFLPTHCLKMMFHIYIIRFVLTVSL